MKPSGGRAFVLAPDDFPLFGVVPRLYRGLREEACKSWLNIRSDVVVYHCDFFSRQFKGRSTAPAIDWIAKYESGRAWFEYHGLLDGERPTEFYAVIEFASDEAERLDVEIGVSGASGRKSMLVDVAQFIQLPEGIVPIGVPSFIRLKVTDGFNGLARHVPNLVSEDFLAARRLVLMNREHDFGARIGVADQRELPRELVRAGTQVVDNIGKTHGSEAIDEREFTPKDVAVVHNIALFRDGIWIGPCAMLHDKRIKFLEMYVRPSNFHCGIITPPPIK